MGLYLPAKKLQMARNDLDHIILCPGELHMYMAMLRTIDSYVENSGIDMCWVEAELYGPSTVLQILYGNHVKRGENAHITTLQALFTLYQEAIGNLNILEKMSTFDAANTSNPMFKVMRHYMRMVMEKMALIRAVRFGDWSLHLITLEMFNKYFFAHDKIPLCTYDSFVPC